MDTIIQELIEAEKKAEENIRQAECQALKIKEETAIRVQELTNESEASIDDFIKRETKSLEQKLESERIAVEKESEKKIMVLKNRANTRIEEAIRFVNSAILGKES